MKRFVPILLFFFTWFSSIATPVFAKITLPTDKFSFSKTENVKQANEIKIGVPPLLVFSPTT